MLPFTKCTGTAPRLGTGLGSGLSFSPIRRRRLLLSLLTKYKVMLFFSFF